MATKKYECGHKIRHKTFKTIKCIFCHKDFVRPSCWPKATKFCSKKCFGKYASLSLSGDNSKNFISGIMNNGYRRLMGRLGRELEHRFVIERYLGRKLSKDEVVHHINFDKLDNRLENLQVLSRSEHNIIHQKLKICL